ncbi:MAG TPA: family 16 glycoside hydrolase, partial [Prosthecobacter sp.]
MIKLTTLSALAGLMMSAATFAADGKDGWISMFNGKDLAGWKSNDEVPGVFTVEDGLLKVSGGRAHLFYVGEDGAASFKSF